MAGAPSAAWVGLTPAPPVGAFIDSLSVLRGAVAFASAAFGGGLAIELVFGGTTPGPGTSRSLEHSAGTPLDTYII